MTFDSFSRQLLPKLGLANDQTEVSSEVSKEVSGGAGLGPLARIDAKGVQKNSTKATRAPYLHFTASSLFDKLCELKEPTLVVLDEFDRLNRRDDVFYGPFADLLKATSDNFDVCHVRFLIVGIGRDAQELLGEHESIERCVVEIFARPLRNEDVRAFLEDIQTDLGFRFEDQVIRLLVEDAMGYPYFVHLVGLNAIDAMVEESPEARLVTLEHYTNGVARAVHRNHRSQLRKYSDSARRLSQIEKNFLLELAHLYRTNKTPQRLDLQKHLASRSLVPIDQFDQVMVSLMQDHKMLYLRRPTDQIRFRDPLMAPFLRFYLFGERVPIVPRNQGQLSLPLDGQD
jgi:hypothetical protein